jgi:hypothetical protein
MKGRLTFSMGALVALIVLAAASLACELLPGPALPAAIRWQMGSYGLG